MLSDVPPIFRKRPARIKTPTRTPPPVAVAILSVTRTDEQHALWLFDAGVSGVEEIAGMLIGGQEPGGLDSIVPNGIVLEYDGGVAVDDPWLADAGLVIAITFDNGGTLVLPQSGNVE